MAYPDPIRQLITSFSRLPSVGRRTAERFVFHLLNAGKKDVVELNRSIEELIASIRSCQACWDFSETSPCFYCSDMKRERNILCIVHEPQDVQAIEKTGKYKGRYHVIRKMIKVDEEDSLNKTKIRELFVRIEQKDITEVILALNPDMPGETTMLFLEKKIKVIRPDLIITRLARGLPMGSDLQYADEITLGSAISHRTGVGK